MVCAHASSEPKIINISGTNFIVSGTNGDIDVNVGVDHINVLPIIVALNESRITAFVMFFGSDIIEYGKLIW